MDSHHYVLHKCRIRKHVTINSVRACCKISRSPRDDVSPARLNFRESSSLRISAMAARILLPLLLFKIRQGACAYARRVVISPATFFPRSMYITRNNYSRDMMPVTSCVLRLRGTMKNNACPRRGESRRINIYYTSRSRAI